MKRIVLFWIPLFIAVVGELYDGIIRFRRSGSEYWSKVREVEEAVSPTRRFPRDRKTYWDLQSLLMKVIGRRMEACRKRSLPMMIL